MCVCVSFSVCVCVCVCVCLRVCVRYAQGGNKNTAYFEYCNFGRFLFFLRHGAQKILSRVQTLHFYFLADFS